MPTDPFWVALYIATALGVFAVGIAVYAVILAERTRDILDRLTAALSRSGVKVSEAARAVGPVGVDDPTRVIASPPQVLTADGSAAVGDWLQHYALPVLGPNGRRSQATWTSVVIEFYRRLEDDPEVMSYFHLSDVPVIRRHVALVMVKITRQGITQGDRDTLQAAHAGVRNRDGTPITDGIYDRVISTLVDVLTENGVPGHAIGDLARMLEDADIRGALVTSPARHATG